MKIRLVPTLIAIGVAEVVLFVSALVPYDSVALPEWQLLVIDANGKPAANVGVHRAGSYGGYQTNWKEIRSTDAQGRVAFPPETVRASLLGRLFTRAEAKASGYPDHATVAAWACFEGQFAITDEHPEADAHGVIRLVAQKGACQAE